MRGLLGLLLLLLAIAGCGGGGGGGGVATGTVTGRVVWLPSGFGPNPPASVQAGNASTITQGDEGTFSLAAPLGSDSLLVVYVPSGGSPITFRFAIPPVVAGTQDVGQLWIGPQTVTVTGRVVNATDGGPVGGAAVSFAGRRAVTGADGTFALAEVAYSQDDFVFFGGIEGAISREGFFPRVFTADREAFGGVVALEDLPLTPESSGTPPDAPYNVLGMVGPPEFAVGTLVTILQNGTPLRRVTVGNARTYGFWMAPGTYTLTFLNPGNGRSAPEQTFTLANTTDVVRRDVTLQ